MAVDDHSRRSATGARAPREVSETPDRRVRNGGVSDPPGATPVTTAEDTASSPARAPTFAGTTFAGAGPGPAGLGPRRLSRP